MREIEYVEVARSTRRRDVSSLNSKILLRGVVCGMFAEIMVGARDPTRLPTVGTWTRLESSPLSSLFRRPYNQIHFILLVPSRTRRSRHLTW